MSEEENKFSPNKLGHALIKALEKCPQEAQRCVKLIEDGADLGLIRMSDRYDALMLAAGIGLPTVVEAALRHSAPVEKKNDLGNTALLEAIDAFALALQGKEHMPFVDQYGRARDYPKTIRTLLKWNAKAATKNSSGQDCLDIIRDLHERYNTEDTKSLLDDIFEAHRKQAQPLLLTQGNKPHL
jgi:ankyrin repeat protein